MITIDVVHSQERFNGGLATGGHSRSRKIFTWFLSWYAWRVHLRRGATSRKVSFVNDHDYFNAQYSIPEVFSSVHVVRETIPELYAGVGSGTNRCCPDFPYQVVALARLYEVSIQSIRSILMDNSSQYCTSSSKLPLVQVVDLWEPATTETLVEGSV